MPKVNINIQDNQNSTQTQDNNVGVTFINQTVTIPELYDSIDTQLTDMLVIQQSDGVTRKISIKKLLITGNATYVLTVNSISPTNGNIELQAIDIPMGNNFFQPLDTPITSGISSYAVAQRTQGQINTVNNALALLKAGKQFTFDPTLVGGYESGAILFNPANNRWVVSLKNNNTANYIANQSLINNIDWSYITTSFMSVEQGGGVGQMANKVNLGWNNTDLAVSIDGASQGVLAKIKDNKLDYGNTDASLKSVNTHLVVADFVDSSNVSQVVSDKAVPSSQFLTGSEFIVMNNGILSSLDIGFIGTNGPAGSGALRFHLEISAPQGTSGSSVSINMSDFVGSIGGTPGVNQADFYTYFGFKNYYLSTPITINNNTFQGLVITLVLLRDLPLTNATANILQVKEYVASRDNLFAGLGMYVQPSQFTGVTPTPVPPANITRSTTNADLQNIGSISPELTEAMSPCIILLNGRITSAGNVFTIPAGAYRFRTDAAYDSVYGLVATPTNITVPGDGFIVARRTVTPMNVSVVFTASENQATDVRICQISSGSIVNLGTAMPTASPGNGATFLVGQYAPGAGGLGVANAGPDLNYLGNLGVSFNGFNFSNAWSRPKLANPLGSTGIDNDSIATIKDSIPLYGRDSGVVYSAIPLLDGTHLLTISGVLTFVLPQVGNNLLIGNYDLTRIGYSGVVAGTPLFSGPVSNTVDGGCAAGNFVMLAGNNLLAIRGKVTTLDPDVMRRGTSCYFFIQCIATPLVPRKKTPEVEQSGMTSSEYALEHLKAII